jgi:membrane-bound metal-dependent hydrolase YbcI (DUF457 family)
MASALGHTVAAYSALIAIRPELVYDSRSHRITAGSAFVLGNLADSDFAVAYLSSHPVLQHHYFSHSIPCAFLVAFLFFLLFLFFRVPQPSKTAVLPGLAYGTHLLLDYFTEDGSRPFGIPLLWPFSHHHFLSPLQIFHSTHRGSWHDLFGPQNVKAVLLEVAILTPFLLLFLCRARRLKNSPERTAPAP